MIRRPFLSLLKAPSPPRGTHQSSLLHTALLRSSSSTPSSSPAEPATAQVSTRHHSKPYIPLYHHQDSSLFPQLIPGSLPYITHNLSSAFSAMMALVSSQEARDRFVSIVDQFNENDNTSQSNDDSNIKSLYGSIINSNVLSQSDMGFIKVLALFDGLNSPLYRDTAFNVKDFMDGASYAIERFHEVGRAHMNFMTERLEAVANDDDNDEDGEQSSNEVVHKKKKRMEYDFLQIAKSNPDSLEHDLMEMTTPVYWGGFQDTMKALVEAPSFLLDILKKQGSPPVSKITHLALLSARVASIEKPIISPDKDDQQDPNAPLEDDALKPHHIIERNDTKPQIVTQLEVLYESEVTLTETTTDENNGSNIRSKMVVDVATFEACIAGDPNGENMQWRLCYTRPALEFGYGFNTRQ